MRWYAADNHYGSRTDIGFANTWYVLVFDSKYSRDQYVEHCPRLSARPIKRREVTNYIYDNPRPFSGEYYGIVADNSWLPDGCIGEVAIVHGGEGYARFRERI